MYHYYKYLSPARRHVTGTAVYAMKSCNPAPSSSSTSRVSTARSGVATVNVNDYIHTHGIYYTQICIGTISGA